MNSPAHDIALRLEALGFGTFGGASGWSIAVSREPLSPATTITVYDTGSAPPGTDEQDWLTPAFQVRVKSDAYPAGYAKLKDILSRLTKDGAFVTTAGTYVSIRATSGVLYIGRDEQDAYLLTANFEALLQEPES